MGQFLNFFIIVLVATLAAGCSLISGSRKIPLSVMAKQEISQKVDGLGMPVGLVNDGSDRVVTAVFAFDGTLNNKDKVPDDEDLTVVAKLYQSIAAPTIDSKKAEGAHLVKYYEKGPGCVGFFACWLDAIWGTSSAMIAQQAIDELKAFSKTQVGTDKGLRIVVIGFSRGAAIARHFMNQVYYAWKAGELNGSIKDAWSYAILFDTVATGQTQNLLLGMPPNLDLAIHYVAKNEARRFYRPVLDDDRTYEAASEIYVGNPLVYKRVYTIYIPGAHSDLGDSYLSGAGPLITALSKRTLQEMGLYKLGVIKTCPDQLSGIETACDRTLDEGLHDSRGLIDYLTFTPSPYSCDFHREPEIVEKPSLTIEDAKLLAEEISKRRLDMIHEGTYMLQEPPVTGNYLFRAVNGASSWEVLFPRVSGFYESPVSITGDPRAPTLTIKSGVNNGMKFHVPSYVMKELIRQGGSATVELNFVMKDRQWWFVNGCLPDE